MDRVALGRALGFGARQAARTLLKVADAATTPAAGSAAAPRVAATVPTASRPQATALVESARHTTGNAKGLGKAVLQPVARFTSVLWLEVTGLFYGVFAMILGTAAWRQWGLAFAPGATGARNRFFLYTGVATIFLYFSLTNFLKARRRGRQ